MTKLLMKGLWMVSLVAVLAALSAPVEAGEVRAHIPFAFTVNGKTLSPGVYTFSNNSSALLVRGQTGGAMVLTNAVESRNDTDAKIVFDKYGDVYLLRQAWMGGGSGREIRPDRAQRELAKLAREGKIARAERVEIPRS